MKGDKGLRNEIGFDAVQTSSCQCILYCPLKLAELGNFVPSQAFWHSVVNFMLSAELAAAVAPLVPH